MRNKMNWFLNNRELCCSGIFSTYYAVDSSVYFSYEKVKKLDLLLKVCDSNVVLTPMVEKEIFKKENIFDFTFIFPNPNLVSSSTKWIKIPENYFTLSGLNTSNTCLGSYRKYFYVANIDYIPTTSNFNLISYNCESFNKLKSDADKEIIKWSISNSNNTILFTNDKLMIKTARSLNVSVIGSIGVLIMAFDKKLISFKEAENIYSTWSVIDSGSCIWLKTNNKKTLKEFEEIYSELNKS